MSVHIQLILLIFVSFVLFVVTPLGSENGYVLVRDRYALGGRPDEPLAEPFGLRDQPNAESLSQLRQPPVKT